MLIDQVFLPSTQALHDAHIRFRFRRETSYLLAFDDWLAIRGIE